MRTNYKVCEMEGRWYVVKDNRILSYEEFQTKDSAEGYCSLLNRKLDELAGYERELRFPR